jgi:hypothetical protein
MKDKWQEIELLAYHIWESEWEALARRTTKAGTPQGKKARPRKSGRSSEEAGTPSPPAKPARGKKAGKPQGKKARARKSGLSSDEAGTPSPPAKPARQKKKPDGAKPAGRTTRRK